MKSAMAYESDVRDFHTQLRTWYYPRMFKSEDFDADMANRALPDFRSSTSTGEQNELSKALSR